MSVKDHKLAAARRAIGYVEPRMKLGLGTGSTAALFVELLAEEVKGGLSVICVPTSEETRVLAERLGIPLTTLDETPLLDLTVDGADEVDAELRLIKGGGGALLREKVVASVSAREVIVVGEDKLVERLAKKFPLPVEVVPFALAVVRRALEKLGARPHLRVLESGVAYATDNNNCILDCRFDEGISDAQALDAALHRIPGVVETGLFLGLAHVLVIGRADGTVQVRERPAR